MPSRAFDKFSNRILEVKRLLSLCTAEDADYRIKKENLQRDSALLRGAHVLLCSHIEGFFEDLVDDMVGAYDKHAVLVEQIPDELKAHQVVGSATGWDSKDLAKRWDLAMAIVSHPLLKNKDKPDNCLDSDLHTAGFANPGTKEVEHLFKSVGLNGVWELFHTEEKDMIYKNSVDAIVNRRNQIAHGKVDATVTLADAQIYVQRIERTVAVFDIIATNEVTNRTKVIDCWAALGD